MSEFKSTNAVRKNIEDEMHKVHWKIIISYIYLQPKFNLQTKELASAEALLRRWIHPEINTAYALYPSF